jgi:hypothetical protein
MNKRMIRQILNLVLLALVLTTIAIAAQQTVTGVISDDMCKQKHMMPGHSEADCTRACVKAGSNYALVSGDKVFILKGDAKQIEKYAGKKVSIAGEVAGSSLQVASIADTE